MKTVLQEIIQQKILHSGAISFHDFMDMALYYPDLGYYTSPKAAVGKDGDFLTAPYMAPVFGAMIGRQIEEMWRFTGCPDVFNIVEFGAGNGMLCLDILNYLQQNRPLWDCLRYCIFEKNNKHTFQTHPESGFAEKIHFYHHLEELGSFTGCIISNELLDNFPVHRIVAGDEIREVYVDYHDHFIETLRPANTQISSYINELDITLSDGFCTEVNLDAIDWLHSIARQLEKGYIITIDYGFSSEKLYHNKRCEGTLMCYYKHTLSKDPYANIGLQDITAHVNFSALEHWGAKFGLSTCGLVSQAAFLLGLDFKSYLLESSKNQADVAKAAFSNALITRMLMLDMGDRFKVMIHRKGVERVDLSGLKFCDQRNFDCC